MTNLLTRLQDASEGSRELDEAIADEMGWTRMEAWSLKTEYWIAPNDDETEHAGPPHYTTSIDAALTLLPKTACNHELSSFIGSDRPELSGMAWAFRFSDRAQLMGERAAHEEIARLKRTSPSFGKFVGEPLVILEKAIAEHFIEFYCEIAATPALALCIAALKARQSTKTEVA